MFRHVFRYTSRWSEVKRHRKKKNKQTNKKKQQHIIQEVQASGGFCLACVDKHSNSVSHKIFFHSQILPRMTWLPLKESFQRFNLFWNVFLDFYYCLLLFFFFFNDYRYRQHFKIDIFFYHWILRRWIHKTGLHEKYIQPLIFFLLKLIRICIEGVPMA